MVVLSCSLPRSASVLLFTYTQDLVRCCHARNGQEQFGQEHMPERGRPGFMLAERFTDPDTFTMLDGFAREHGPFVVKTHSGLTPPMRRFLEGRLGKATYIHRDPRDALLSLIDKARMDKPHKATPTLEEMLPKVRQRSREAVEWINSGLALVLRFVEFVTNPVRELLKVAEYLELPVTRSQVERMVAQREEGKQPGVLNYNTGKLTRFASEMTAEQMEWCRRNLASEISALGYDVEAEAA